MDINQRGVIYYGTDIKYIEDLDKNGLEKPRVRNEQYISVSVSGYHSKVKCEHPEIKEIARIFVNELKAASFKDNCLHF